MITMSDPGPAIPSLDILLLTYCPVFRKGKLLTSNLDTSVKELQQFREYAIAVDQEFAKWPARQPLKWQPTTLGLVDPAFKNGLLPGLTSSPSRIDVYLDGTSLHFKTKFLLRNHIVFVSSVWNNFRKCRLLLLCFIYQCSIRLQLLNTDTEESYEIHDIFTTAEKLSEDVAASIPFHLVRNPEVFVTAPVEDQHGGHKQPHIIPNLSAGGLLIMHTIFVVSTALVVPEQIRQSCIEYLVFIGQTIGQAEVIADVSPHPHSLIDVLIMLSVSHSLHSQENLSWMDIYLFLRGQWFHRRNMPRNSVLSFTGIRLLS